MKKQEIKQWAENLHEGDERVDWQKKGDVTPAQIARIVRAEEPATDAELQQICDQLNAKIIGKGGDKHGERGVGQN